jgi:FtsP/CotA-like multicopper oxidase with cupredoxin domain/plastocyanin
MLMIPVVLEDDFRPGRAIPLAPRMTSPENPWVLSLRGRRLAGRVTATAAAFALAATAVLLNGQASPDAALDAAAGSRAGVAAADAATIEILPAAFGAGKFQPATTNLAVGGTLTVTNSTNIAHTFTSDAVGSNGKPLFNVRLEAGESKTIDAVKTLNDGTYGFYCLIHPAMRGTLVVGAGGPVVGEQTFEQPLVQPARLHGKHLRIVMRKADVRVLPDGPRTPMLTFGGTFPGPTIVRRAGQDTMVTFVNRLPRKDGAVTVHQHAGHQKAKFDGQPASHLIRHGKKLTYDYPLRDAGTPLPAALRFYHDHRMDLTARNNWLGLQGMFLTTDPRDAQRGLPHGKYDIPLAITDRSFRADNRLKDPFQKMSHRMANDPSMSGMARVASPGMETVGDQVLVNGRFAPYKKVQPGLYRLRLFNSSLFSSYDFALSNGRPFTQIGTGSGLLPHPVVRQDILLGPAQRADVIVDFRGQGGTDVLLDSIPRNNAPTGATGTRSAALMQFRVRGTPAPKAKIPDNLAKIQHYKVPRKVTKTWRFGLSKSSHWTIDGKRYAPKRIDAKVRLGSVQRWKLVNTSPFTHFIHLHEELWRTLERDGHKPPPWERGYEDTWLLDPGESVVVAARFTDYTGKFMIHCHMLDHEDDGMMATFAVVKKKR